MILPSLNMGWEENDTEEIIFLTQDEIKELFAARPMDTTRERSWKRSTAGTERSFACFTVAA